MMIKNILKFIYTLIFFLPGFAFASIAPVPPAAQTVTICEGSVVVLSAATPNAAGYQWYFNGQMIAAATQNKYAAG
ncbi:MAG: hypothetical protein EOP42_12160, partial [Sphingobacteriaceae bacterium]